MAAQAHITTLPVPANALRLRPFGCPAGVSPSLWRKALRQRIEANLAAVEALLAALDEMTPDPDLEHDGTELDVSAPEGWRPARLEFYRSEDDEDADPAEPTLGWGRAHEWDRQTLIATERDTGEREVDDDFEAVNEDGGDILDVGHDAAFGGDTFVTEGNGSGEV